MFIMMMGFTIGIFLWEIIIIVPLQWGWARKVYLKIYQVVIFCFPTLPFIIYCEEARVIESVRTKNGFARPNRYLGSQLICTMGWVSYFGLFQTQGPNETTFLSSSTFSSSQTLSFSLLSLQKIASSLFIHSFLLFIAHC